MLATHARCLPVYMQARKAIMINRAPVLTLWAAIVAERLGFARDEALTLGRAVAGLNAYSKGVKLGLYEPRPQSENEHLRKAKDGEELSIDLLHRAIPAVQTPHGVRALSDGRPITPQSVECYLEGKFGNTLNDARDAMMTLARSLPASELATRSCRLYERFRPDIPAGVAGWGAKGMLSLDRITALVEKV